MPGTHSSKKNQTILPTNDDECLIFQICMLDLALTVPIFFGTHIYKILIKKTQHIN